jgi:cytochrome c5
MAQGEAFYPKCAACHGDSGAGTPGLAPPLAGASWVTGPPEWLGRIILQGMTGPVDVNGESWDGVMPPHGHLGELDDATLAGLMTYMRRSWGNKANPVSTEAVAAIREASAGRGKPWTAGELEAVPFDRGYTRFVGKYGISFITMTIKEEPDGLHMSVPMYGSGLLTPITETLFQGGAGGEEVKVEFVVEENGVVNQFILHRKAEKLSVKRKSG